MVVSGQSHRSSEFQACHGYMVRHSFTRVGEGLGRALIAHLFLAEKWKLYIKSVF